MTWHAAIHGFKAHIRLERGLSANTFEAYQRDLGHLQAYIERFAPGTTPDGVSFDLLREFVHNLADMGLEATTQARMVSGVRAFYKFLVLDGALQSDPSHLLELPRLGRHLPDVLTAHEVEVVLNGIDLSAPEGHRNRAMLEVLYGCGLRVSELINLPISGLHLNQGYVRVVGKGNKERLVPIGKMATRQVEIYLSGQRAHDLPKRGHDDVLFLNRRGAALSRQMVFYVVKLVVILVV